MTTLKMNYSHTVPALPAVDGIFPVQNCLFCNKPVKYNFSMGRYTTTDGQGAVRCYYNPEDI
jgi:hypothetical protein